MFFEAESELEPFAHDEDEDEDAVDDELSTVRRRG
jgi:hypothetical protein